MRLSRYCTNWSALIEKTTSKARCCYGDFFDHFILLCTNDTRSTPEAELLRSLHPQLLPSPQASTPEHLSIYLPLFSYRASRSISPDTSAGLPNSAPPCLAEVTRREMPAAANAVDPEITRHRLDNCPIFSSRTTKSGARASAADGSGRQKIASCCLNSRARVTLSQTRLISVSHRMRGSAF